MFCKPEVKLILESLCAGRQNGRAEIKTGCSGDIENHCRIQDRGFPGSLLLMQTVSPGMDTQATVCRTSLLLQDYSLSSYYSECYENIF